MRCSSRDFSRATSWSALRCSCFSRRGLSASSIVAARQRRRITALFVLVYGVGKCVADCRIYQDGRGPLLGGVAVHGARRALLRFASRATAIFGAATLLAFYSRYLPTGKTIWFYPRGSTRESGEADWRIVEDVEPRHRRADWRSTTGRAVDFGLVGRFPFYGLSGCQWSLISSGLVEPLQGVEPNSSIQRRFAGSIGCWSSSSSR